jgi:glucan phosphoethanolaminetransferase (alkaline phosphatase superfamily)
MPKILKSLSDSIENEYKNLSDGKKSLAICGAIFFLVGGISIWILKALSDAGVSQVTSPYKTAWAMAWGMIFIGFFIFITSFKKPVFRYFFIFVFCCMFLVFISESDKILMPEFQFLFSSKVKNIFFYGLLVSGALALYHFQKKKKNENK